MKSIISIKELSHKGVLTVTNIKDDFGNKH